jgi:hypothetical protein
MECKIQALVKMEWKKEHNTKITQKMYNFVFKAKEKNRKEKRVNKKVKIIAYLLEPGIELNKI